MPNPGAAADIRAMRGHHLPRVDVAEKPTAVFMYRETIGSGVVEYEYAAALASLTINQGAQMVYKNRPNSEKIHYVDRKVTGQVSIECPKTDVKDFFAICSAGTTGALAMTHGTTVGYKGILAASTVQLTNPRTSEGDNMVMLAMDMIFLPSDAGNDELTYATQ